jgi:DNA-binding IclR family transcriptional regulator
MSVVVGEEAPPHATAIGKAVLAYLKEPDRTRLLGREPYRQFTDRTKWSRRQVEAELKLTADRGYAVDNEEVTADAVCIGSVILNQRGEPVGALSLSATVARFRRERWDELGALVAESCTHLSGSLAAASVSPKRMNGERSAL